MRVTTHDGRLNEPYMWEKPQKIFVCSMGDLFHPDVSVTFLEGILARMTNCPQHIFMVLTKRPERLKLLTPDRLRISRTDTWPIRNLWLGVTAENQRTADERIPILLQIPAAKRFVSIEPMLGPVNLNNISMQLRPGVFVTGTVLGTNGRTFSPCGASGKGLDWVICGAETGTGARPCSVDWVRDLQRQCAAADVPFFDKRDILGEGLQEWPR